MSSSALASSPPAAAQCQSPAANDRKTEDLITYCCVCFLPVDSVDPSRAGNIEGNPPFWLTSCGHIICGSHVFPGGVPQNAANTTHTCPYCNSGGISLADLSVGKVSLELRDYFRPESDLLEDVAGAIKFRMKNAIRIASHYKALAQKLQGKLDDQRRVLLKVKDELIEGKELKKQKFIMDTEITKLRQEVSQLRAQLSSAQLSSLDYDGLYPGPQQNRSETENPQQNLISPLASVIEVSSGHKRKADDDDPSFRARDFRDEMNKRQAMPPPPLPQQAQQAHQQYQDNRVNGQGQDRHQGLRVGVHADGYNDKLGCSPQRQHIYEDRQIVRGAPNQHDRQSEYHSVAEQQPLQNEYVCQFVDLTEPTELYRDPPALSSPRGQTSYGNNINVPFRSPIRISNPMPNFPLPVRGIRDGYMTSANPQTPKFGAGYVNAVPQSLNANNFHPPVFRGEHLSPLRRQGGNPGYPYSRGEQANSAIPSTPRSNNKEARNVVSPFFTGPSAPTKSLGVSAIGGGVRRPASMASLTGQHGNLSRPHGGELGDRGFFSREHGGVVVVGAGVPGWTEPQAGHFMGGGGGVIRPETVGGFGEKGGNNMFNPQRGRGGGLASVFRAGIGGDATGGGVVDRPGLRRVVRRD